jgi:hypothetical protein
MEANTNDDRKESTACQDAMEVNPERKEPNSDEKEAVVERQEVPKEDAPVAKTVNERRKWHRGRKLTAGRRGEPKELIREDCGSRRKLAAACRKVSRRAKVARRKRNVCRKIWTEVNCGSRSTLTAAGRRMTRSAKVAWRRGHKHKRYNRTNCDKKPRNDERMGRDLEIIIIIIMLSL